MGTFVWKTSDFSSRPEKNGQFLKSELITICGPGDRTTKWCVWIYPRNEKSCDSNYVSVFLHNESEEAVSVKFSVSTLDADNKKRKMLDEIYNFGTDSKFGFGLTKLCHRNEIARIAPNGSLTLVFDIIVLGETKGTIQNMEDHEENNALSQNYHHVKLSMDYAELLTSKENADVKITCGGKEFWCHKLVLTTRSPVFRSMFESNMKEKITGSVEIKTMNPEVFEDLLKYIYTGDIKIDSNAKGLFEAADQYQLDELKEFCEAKLCSSIDSNNCIELLVLGDLHQAPMLKKAALHYVSGNLNEVLNDSEWRRSLVPYPNLMADVMEMMVPKKNESAEEKKLPAS